MRKDTEAELAIEREHLRRYMDEEYPHGWAIHPFTGMRWDALGWTATTHKAPPGAAFSGFSQGDGHALTDAGYMALRAGRVAHHGTEQPQDYYGRPATILSQNAAPDPGTPASGP